MKIFRARKTCGWETHDPLYVDYHHREWGVPCFDDRIHYEFLILEAAQAGLSWLTVLRKRENYRKAFAGFDPRKVARFGAPEIRALLRDPGIIRNRLKVEAAVHNARRFLEVQSEFGGFSKYIWGFVGGKPILGRRRKLSDLPATTPESDALSRDMKRRGFKFVGPTVLYAHMQALGLANDHLVRCFRYRQLARPGR
jgi:DNA-3-methyladenine glycosylase I